MDFLRELFYGPDDPTKIIQCSADDTCVVVHSIASALLVFFILLTGFAYTTVLERRLIASIQSRIGPNRAGPKGLLQPVADGIKLIFKEDITPIGADRVVFWVAPVVKLIPALIVLAVVPLGPQVLIPWFDGNWYRVNQGIIDVEVGALWILAVTSISVYGVALAGWASNNKYSMLGALRSSASMISYELSLSLTFAVPILLASSMSMVDIANAQSGIANWYIFQNPLSAVILWVALMAEIARAPFDMPEAEQELVAGHMTEYSGMKFALFFMAEYINMIGISVVFSSLFLGGYDDGLGLVQGLPVLGPVILGIKVFLLLSFLIWIRATVARPRYDRLMEFGWKIMLPGAMLGLVWTAISVTIVEEGAGTGAYIASTVLLFVVLGTIAYALNRSQLQTLPVSIEEQLERAERNPGYILLSFVGGLLSIPFLLWGNFGKPLMHALFKPKTSTAK
jgi:NADH-quinone oxidoreductase subunit H